MIDILKIIESYNIDYDIYKHSVLKCTLYGKIQRLQWLHDNKYKLTLYDVEFCECPPWQRNLSDEYRKCSHCQYVSCHKLMDFAIKQKQHIIVKWLLKLKQ